MSKGTDFSPVRLMNDVAAGTSNQNSAVLDMAGWDGVIFLTAFGAITASAVTSVKVQEDTDPAGGTMADIAGSGVSLAAGGADDNKTVMHDVYRALKRYLRVVVLRATANAVIDGVWAIRYRGSKLPPTLDVTIKSLTTLVSPSEGAP